MRWLLALALMCAACGEDRVPPPAGGDGGSAVAAPRLDAGTGDCRDDYRITVEYCNGIDASGPTQASCWLAAVELYEGCIGPRESCVTRCGLENTGDVIQMCIDSCPTAPDAG